MIRVVHVITRTNIGGPSVIVASLIGDPTDPGIEQTLVRGSTPAEEGDYFSGSPLAGRIVTIAPLGRRVRPSDDFRALVALVRHLRAVRPDVVHTHMAKAGALGRIAAFVARVPVRVHTYHGHLLSGYFSPFVTRLVVLAERLLQLITTHTVVVGRRVHNDLVAARITSGRRSRVINPGVVPFEPGLPAESRRLLGLPLDGVVVGFVGRFAPIKRPDRFVRLARRLADEPEVHFLMVGDGPLLEDTRRSCDGISNMHFLPWQRDLAQLLAAVDIVVMCSDNEGVPLLVIEAGMAGRPVVSTRVGSVDDVVADGVNGLLVEGEDDEAMGKAVRRLVRDPGLRATLGQAGRLRAVEGFTASVANSAHAAMYRELVTAVRAGR